MARRHLVTVWNPQYAPEAMDQHLGVLLDWARRRSEGAAEDDDVYVWWGKLASANRQKPMPHRDEVLALNAQAESGEETHLYLTDYRSLYVAHVGAVEGDDVRKDAAEKGHIPDYYFGREEVADCWFLLWDIRRLVGDDTTAVGEELRHLRNQRYGDRPVSLYGGMVEIPLVVRRDGEEAEWFSDRESLIGKSRWAERDRHLRGETERLGAELRDNLVGRDAWARISLTARGFLSTAESVFRRHRDDLHFDFAAAAIEYAKAIEVELNALLRPGLREVGETGHVTLGSFARLLNEPPPALKQWLQRAFGAKSGFFTGELPLRLGAIADLRNPGAHEREVGLARASSLRDETLGIGQEGLMVRLAGLRR
jgi:hypothetical protein